MRGLNNQSGQAIRIVLVCSGKIVLLWTPTGSRNSPETDMRGLNNQSGQAIRIVLVCSGKIVLLWTPTGSRNSPETDMRGLNNQSGQAIRIVLVCSGKIVLLWTPTGSRNSPETDMRGLNNQSGQAIRIVLVCSGKIVLLWTPTGSPHIRGPPSSGRGQGGCGAGPWPSHGAAQCVAMRCVTSEPTPTPGGRNGPAVMSHMYSAASSLPPYLYGLNERSVTWVPSGISLSRLALACTPPGMARARALQPTSRCLAFSTQMPRPMSTSTTMESPSMTRRITAEYSYIRTAWSLRRSAAVRGWQ